MTSTTELQKNQGKPILILVPLFSLFVGVFILSSAAILIRWSEQEVGPYATILNRLWIAAVVLWLGYGIKTVSRNLFNNSPTPQQTDKLTVQDFVLLLADGVVGSACLGTWAWSLTQTSITNSNLLHNVSPIFAAFGGWLFFRQHFDGKFIIGMMLAVIGASVISVEDWKLTTNNFVGDALALFSAILNSLHYLIREKLRVRLTTTTILRWYCLLGSIIIFPFAFFTEDRLFPVTVLGWLPLISLAVLCSILGQGIVTHYLKQFPSGFVTLFLLLEPVLTATLAWLLFDEHLSLLGWSAFFMVLSGIYLAKSSQDFEKSSQTINTSAVTE